MRVTLELDREVRVSRRALDRAGARVLRPAEGVQLTPALMDTVAHLSRRRRRQDPRRPPSRTTRARVVLDLEGVARYSVFTLYNPFRVVIDCRAPRSRRDGCDADASRRATEPAPSPTPPLAAAPLADRAATRLAVGAAPAPRPAAPRLRCRAANACRHANGAGGFSLARQLGLGVSRIVIDPGHGGHDPGRARPRPDRSRRWCSTSRCGSRSCC